MDLIFHNGEKLYKKQQDSLNNVTNHLENMCGVKLHSYQKTFIEDFFNFNKSDGNIYGDDFKIEFTPKNLNGNCGLTIKDYNENQEFEQEIRIDFTKSELSQLITLLQTIKDM